jgi:Leucine-rich repeat (LRR) protein
MLSLPLSPEKTIKGDAVSLCNNLLIEQTSETYENVGSRAISVTENLDLMSRISEFGNNIVCKLADIALSPFEQLGSRLINLSVQIKSEEVARIALEDAQEGLSHNLKEWCDEKYNDEEYLMRIIASEVILRNYTERTEELSIGFFSTTSRLLTPENSQQLLSSYPKSLLTSLPEAIGYLTHLKKLSICDHRIKQLPNGVINLVNLRSIDLNNNKFEEFPSELISLTDLRVVNINRNCIKEVPSEMKSLDKLEEFFIGRNELDDLPLKLTGSKVLRKLDLTNNPLKNLSMKQVKQIVEMEERGVYCLYALTSVYENMSILKDFIALDEEKGVY